jgi:hypothetical protein
MNGDERGEDFGSGIGTMGEGGRTKAGGTKEGEGGERGSSYLSSFRPFFLPYFLLLFVSSFLPRQELRTFLLLFFFPLFYSKKTTVLYRF